MRIALIAVVVVLASPQARASADCMTLPEARAKFGGAHLWWHGPNRCWDATPSRRRLAERGKPKNSKETSEARAVERAATPAERAAPAEAKPPQRWSHDTRWREAMSRMLPDDAVPVPPPALQPSARASAAIDSRAMRAASGDVAPPPAPRPDWRERWVELAPAIAPSTAPAPAPRTPGKMIPADLAAEVNDAPVVTPGRVMLALLAVVLVLGFVELLFRSTIPDWRQRRNRQPE